MGIITERIYRFDIPGGKQKERIDVFLANSLERASRTRAQKLIESGWVTVNGKVVKSNYKVQPLDQVVVSIPVSPRPEKAEPENIPLDIIFEDEHLVIVNKPAGMTVHPALGNFSGTMVNALLYHFKQLSTGGDENRPGVVHRIDKETSGLLVVAKDDYTHAQLSKQFARHTIDREYQALVWGTPKPFNGEITGNIARSPKDRKKFAVSETSGKYAHTFYELLEEYEFLSLLRLRLKTGRTHQIRVHCAHIGHPLFGDPVYGGRAILYGSNLPKIKARVENLLEIITRQALHARTLGFIHPVTKQYMQFESPLPADIVAVIDKVKTTN